MTEKFDSSDDAGLQQRRDEIADAYFDSLPFDPYPVQEEALLAWFTEQQGVLVCAPTGTGKTLIAEAALFEALQLGKKAYYTTPLIALTDQKFREIQETVVRWGYSPEDVGLVTGNKKVNPQAKILVVVAEILLNRLLDDEAFAFDDVWAVVMDEFHSFNLPERGIVWEFGLALLPAHVKTMLLSATVGNSMDFLRWLNHVHQRSLKLIEGTERKVPLQFNWVQDDLLPDHMEKMVTSDDATRRTPALLFCFNREMCWTTAEMLKGKKCVAKDQQKTLSDRLNAFDWSQGAGPKMKQLLMRGIGVHHAGVLPKYRRIVEQLFQEKLLSICVCTETLAAGINLPARSVVLPTILKGPPGKMKLMAAAGAHQIFGRAGRPQFDDHGYVYVLPHEDDVKIARWKEKYDSIPDDTKDPGLRKAKKALKKKQPKRREGQQYWSQAQFEQLVAAPSADLESRGPLPWRLLVYMLNISADVQKIRTLVNKRLLDGRKKELAQKDLNAQLITLWRGGYVTLNPKPPAAMLGADRTDAGLLDQDPSQSDAEVPDAGDDESLASDSSGAADGDHVEESHDAASLAMMLDLGQRKSDPIDQTGTSKSADGVAKISVSSKTNEGLLLPGAGSEASQQECVYRPDIAMPTEKMQDLLLLRGVHPLYAIFLTKHLGIADRNERVMAFESLLDLSRSLGKAIRIPKPDEMPPGPLATERLDSQLLKLGLATVDEFGYKDPEEDEEKQAGYYDQWVPILTLPHKLQRLFQYDFPAVQDLRITPVWVAGEVLQYGTDFNKYITANKLQKQEGILFRHLLRLVLLLDEMVELCPPDVEFETWRDDLNDIANQLEETCRAVEPEGTDQWLAEGRS